jgi:NAD(P)-dependent dehydrogenase (short-subunit alcohol dehydrogenase family)
MAGSGRVVVITGTGGMGMAIAHRIGSGSTVVLADVDEGALSRGAATLRSAGHEVVEHVVDVSNSVSVERFAAAAAERGHIGAVVHTAGLSPVQASVDAILRVDLFGTALMLDAFGSVIGAGGAGVFIASMAGTMASLAPELEARLMRTPTHELLELPELGSAAVPDSGTAYSIAKRANHLRVQSASLTWGRRGGRVNTISPGIIATPMGQAELDGPSGEMMRAMIAGSCTGRIGTPDDIADAVEFLVGPNSTFITGTDVLVDGGVVASLRFAPG